VNLWGLYEFYQKARTVNFDILHYDNKSLCCFRCNHSVRHQYLYYDSTFPVGSCWLTQKIIHYFFTSIFSGFLFCCSAVPLSLSPLYRPYHQEKKRYRKKLKENSSKTNTSLPIRFCYDLYHSDFSPFLIHIRNVS